MLLQKINRQDKKKHFIQIICSLLTKQIHPLQSLADSLEGREGDWESKGPQFKFCKGPSLRIGNNTTLRLMQQ